MSTLLSQLGVGGNPLSTNVGQRIEQATDGSLASENWALNMEICDIINDTDDGPKDALKAIRRRLQQNVGKNYTVVMYTLIVLETCVKNCGKRFQLLASQKDFVQELVKLIGPKNDPPTAVQEKVLCLIQCWAETFRSNPEMQGVVQVYTDLKQKGIEFPVSEIDTMAPIITPLRTVPVQPPEIHEIPEMYTRENSVPSISPSQMDKLKKELEIVRGNMNVFSDMLTELVPGQEHQNDLELLTDLYKTCQSMQSRIVELIDKVGNEKITEDLLLVNDELNNLFVRYERFDKKRANIAKAPTVPEQVVTESKPLIDLEDSITPVSEQLKGLDLGAAVSTTVPSTAPDNLSGIDEFDMLAQSRRNIESPKEVTAGAVSTEFSLEQDVHEVARWLDDKPEGAQEINAEPTTEEFERFLASRAAAAERLPTVNPLSPTSNNLKS